MTLTAPPERLAAPATDARRTSSAPSRSGLLNVAEISFSRRTPPGAALCEADSRQPGQAREFVTAALVRWGLPEYTDRADLLTSELVTNAVQHGTAPISLRILHTEARIGVVVTGSPYTPVLSAPLDELSESGRGLRIVGEVADAWGISEDGSRTWCLLNREVPLPAELLAPSPHLCP
ncbi:ATP-binding protein [Streptomyces sp. BE147]|uniref:ATP-binding protein n=1 Tax=Streptomyces sp. BE147 TaxID=3002524 RepID=UPI003FA765E8